MVGKRELAYWGAGDIGKSCVEYYPDTKPDFFIDSNKGMDSDNFCGIPLKKPDEVKNWNNVFIVITTTAIEEIEKILNGKNLKRNENYAKYKDFFKIPHESFEQKLTKVENFILENPEYENAILISAPVFSSRVSTDMIYFFKQYGVKRKPQKCILFADLQVVQEEDAREIMGYPVFDYSDLCYWNGTLRSSMCLDRNSLKHDIQLSAKEKEWILDLEERELYEDKELSFRVTAEIYWYFKNVFLTLKPSKVIIWGGWERQSCIQAKLAKEMGISFGYMEHGWIPGTFLFDQYWVDEYDKYFMEPKVNIEIGNRREIINHIKKHIIDNRVDTGKYRQIEDDEKRLKHINTNEKTIFFAGTDDYGIGINPESKYWKKYIMPAFSSSTDAALFLAKMCKKNGWNFIYKPHPNSTVQTDLNKIENTIIQVKYTDIDRLIQLSDVIVTVGSKVDYKVLMYGKPLLQLGHITLYRQACSYNAENAAQIEPLIKTALKDGMTQEQHNIFESHMAQLLEYHLWDDLTDRDLRYGLSLDTDFL